MLVIDQRHIREESGLMLLFDNSLRNARYNIHGNGRAVHLVEQNATLLPADGRHYDQVDSPD